MYDVYYTTGGGPWVNAGTDLWVNDFLENVVPHLKVRPVLLIHRTKPKGFEDFEFPIETHWQGDNVGEFEKICNEARRINILENSKNGFITSSGMSAISAVLLSLCRSGEHVIAGDQLYGRTSRLLQEDLPRLGIKTTFVDTTDYKKVQESITKKTRIVIIELISNPTLRISDIIKISKLCKKNKIESFFLNLIVFPS